MTQSNMAQFRSDTGNLLGDHGFWIDVTAANVGSFRWLDGSSVTGLTVYCVASSLIASLNLGVHAILSIQTCSEIAVVSQ